MDVNITLDDLPSRIGPLDAVADKVLKIGRRMFLVLADVTIQEHVNGMMESFSTELRATLEGWEQLVAVNARGSFLCYKIKQGRGGRIICASTAGGESGPLTAAYSASKLVVRGFSTMCWYESLRIFSSLRFLFKQALKLGRWANSYALGTTGVTVCRISDPVGARVSTVVGFPAGSLAKADRD
ncbi:hypothetical protein JVT61DRAFT_12563 [Boletus reticuloceps]|uniref:Uncharacterized protein n=1 Tax=Boletus reticuloceps TaxID=495285 RepID=A0A8I2YDK9_9AGAM|nr:hypothetical protein JVT61DRAFT_12563 [Boletus reticuloceps]